MIYDKSVGIVIERFGSYRKTLGPGIHFVVCV